MNINFCIKLIKINMIIKNINKQIHIFYTNAEMET